MKRASVAVLAATALSSTLALSGCGSSGSGSKTIGGGTTSSAKADNGVVSQSAAQQMLTQFATENNQANQARSSSVLAGFEAGSSYQLDAGSYLFYKVTDPANHNYTAINYTQPVFYIPHQTSYPAWFVVKVHQQDVTPPKSGSGSGDQYLLFTRQAAGSPWMLILEPNVLTGVSAPQIATNGNGNATKLAPGAKGQLALAPNKLPAADVGYLDAGTGPTAPARPGLPAPKPSGPVTNFADGKTNVGDFHDQSFFNNQAPGQLLVQDRHSTNSDPVYALKTSDGGALAFYDTSAQLLVSTTFGQLFSLKYSGFISGTQKDANFEINYREQFAVYEPPGTPAKPQVIAEYSGPVSAECGGGPC